MKYLTLVAALVVGLMWAGSAISEQGMIQKDGGIVTIPSNHSVDETVDRVKSILQSKEIAFSR